MTHYLVTGGAGFIGTAAVDLLTRDGADSSVRVTVLERRPIPEALTPVFGRPQVSTLIVEGSTVEALQAAFQTVAPFDAVLHFAGGGVDPQNRSAVAMVDANVGLVARLAEALPHAVNFVYSGSCAEYGRVPEGVKVDESALVAPIEPYGATKAAGAHVGRVLIERKGGRFIHARAFGVYGVREADYRLIPYLAAKLRAGETVDLTPGEQVRDFMFVEDCARALIALARAPADHDVYNVCTGSPVTVAEIARETCRALGADENKLQLGARPYRDGESMWMVGDPGRLHATGFSSQVNLASGVRRMLDLEA